MELVPFLEDLINEEKPFFKKNVTSGAYKLYTFFDKLRPLFSGLHITNDDIKILKAVIFEQGYKFKNLHVYCITQCGGAMEESKCPESVARIRGTPLQDTGLGLITTQT